LKIALITETFLPKVDGIVTRVAHTARELVHLGHEVEIYSPQSDRETYEGAGLVGFDWFTLPYYPDNRMALPSPRLAFQLNRLQPDLVHAVAPFFLGVFACVWARANRVPLVISYHINLPDYLKYSGLEFYAPLLWRGIREAHALADVNLCTSSIVLEELRRREFPRLSLWPRAVDDSAFHPDHRDPEWRDRLQAVYPGRKLALYTGRLSAEKCIDSLRPALESRDDVHLVIVGDGPQRASLEEHFRNLPATFLGLLQGEELAQAYAGSDFFIFPSKTETLGLVLLEALASGLPVLAARSGGITDALEGAQQAAFFYEPDHPASLAESLEHIIAVSGDPEIRAAARKSVRAHTWAASVAKLEEYYQSALVSPVHKELPNPAQMLSFTTGILAGWGVAGVLGLKTLLEYGDAGAFSRIRHDVS